jgi:hypothetical protein
MAETTEPTRATNGPATEAQAEAISPGAAGGEVTVTTANSGNTISGPGVGDVIVPPGIGDTPPPFVSDHPGVGANNTDDEDILTPRG